MPATILSRTTLALLATLVSAVPARADEAWSITGLVDRLFGGGTQAQAQEPAEPVNAGPTTGEIVPQTSAQIDLTFAPLVRATALAVVNVYAARKVASRSPFAGDPFFEQFFGDRYQSRPRIESSLGSGVIVAGEGLVVTNNHVVEGADEVRIALSDGREFNSTILLKDAGIDLAILRIEADEAFAYVPIADSDEAEIGDLVLAIGNPFGIGQTVTSGIVSALARTHVGIADFGFFIQTDAAINPGNSGGALIDMTGELIGVNTAIFTRSGGSNGIGFAIPANMVRVFVEAASSGRPFERPYVGADFADVTVDIAEALGLPRPRGALIEAVDDSGSAAEAGLRPGDVILSMDGFEIDGPDALGYRLATTGIGRDARLHVLSGGAEKDLSLALVPAPEEPARDERRLSGGTPFDGALVANLSPKLAGEIEMPATRRGVVVLDVARGSPAARFGLRPKDIVLALNGTEVDSTQALDDALMTRSRGWRYEIERNGQRLVQAVR